MNQVRTIDGVDLNTLTFQKGDGLGKVPPYGVDLSKTTYLEDEGLKE